MRRNLELFSATLLALAGSACLSAAPVTSTTDGGTTDGGTTDAGTDAGTCTAHEPDHHRPVAVACDHTRPSLPVMVQSGPPAMCMSHADCTAGVNGRCLGNAHDGWACTYDLCFDDSTCGKGVCACEGGFRSDANVCLTGGCQLDADCGPCGYCSPSFGQCGNYEGVVGYFCHSSQDECTNDFECATDGGVFGGGYCAFSATAGHWMCSTSQCAG